MRVCQWGGCFCDGFAFVEQNTSLAIVMESSAELTALYRAEFPYVWNVLFRLGVTGPEREDFAQEAFAAAFKQWPQYDRSRPVKPWLFGISYRLVRDFRRKHQHRFERHGLEQDQIQGHHRSAEEVVARQQGLQLVQRALESMELERRAVFVMHEIEGHPIPAVSEELQIPLNTAYSRLRLARRDFNQFVARLHPEQGAAQ